MLFDNYHNCLEYKNIFKRYIFTLVYTPRIYNWS